jgi:hypothetical protein
LCYGAFPGFSRMGQENWVQQTHLVMFLWTLVRSRNTFVLCQHFAIASDGQLKDMQIHTRNKCDLRRLTAKISCSQKRRCNAHIKIVRFTM